MGAQHLAIIGEVAALNEVMAHNRLLLLGKARRPAIHGMAFSTYVVYAVGVLVKG